MPPLSGQKRRRPWEKEDDDLDLLYPSKRLKLTEDTWIRGPGTDTVSGFRRKLRPRRNRSNSIDRTGSPLSLTDRITGSTVLKKEDMKDFSVIAVFSREAFENFGKTWKAKMDADTLDRATLGSRKGVSTADAMGLLSRQSRSVFGPDFKAQVQALLEKKSSPHVIAVIEGKQEMESFSLKTQVDGKSIDAPYKLVKYKQGTNTKGSDDNKQSMSFYVREDMLKVYSFSEEAVTHKSGKIISSVGVNYATEDGTKYRSLIVHIPNEFIGNKTKEADTHQSLRDYAQFERNKANPIIVTSYFGDTNYSTSMGQYSSPSMGGHLPSGRTLHPQSSGAKKETHFMQSVQLSEGDRKHSVLQASTLNSVFITPDAGNREATDHPSVMQYVAHDSPLAGRSDTASMLLDFEFE